MRKEIGISDMSIPPIAQYNPSYMPIPTVQPFTYRDGLTYWEKLNGIVRYVQRVVIPYIEDNLDVINSGVATDITNLINEVNTSISTMETYVNDSVDSIINSSVEVQDPIVRDMVNNVSSLTRLALDTVYASVSSVTDTNTRIDGIDTSITDIDTRIDTIVNTTIPALDAIINGRLSDASLDAKYASISDVTAATDAANAANANAETRVLKNSYVFSVEDYGAVGDGITDDAPAIAATFTAASAVGGTVLFPKGKRYGRKSTLRVPGNITIVGYGASLVRLPGSTGGTVFQNWASGDISTTAFNGRSNITILGLTIEAEGDTITAFPANIATFVHCRNIWIRDCTFRNTSGFHAVEFNSVNGGIIDNCVFEGYDANGQALKGSIQLDCAISPDGGASDGTMTTNVKVINNTFRASDQLGAPHISVESHSVNGSGGSYTNIIVSGNYMEGNVTYGVRPYAWRDSKVSDNIINLGVAGQGIRSEGSIDLMISNNIVKCPPTSNTGILVGVLTGYTVRGVTVVGNKVYNPTVGIYVGALSGIHIADNYIYRSTGHGINLDNSGNCMVVGNYIDGPGYTTGVANGVRLSGTGADNTVISNRVRPHGSGTEAPYAVSAASTQTNTMVFGNDFRGMPAAIEGTVATTSNRI